MNFKKKSQSHFQTFRLFGKHAQKILESARVRLQSTKEDEQADRPTPQVESEEKIVLHLAVISIVKAAVTVLGIVLLGYLCYLIRDKILLFLLGIFLAVVIDPGVTFLERWKLPRGFAILLVYLLVLAALLFLVVSLIPIIAEQIQQMAVRLAERIDAFLAEPFVRLPFLNQEINQYLSTLLRQVLADISTGGTLQTLQNFGERLSNAAQGSIVFVVGVAGSVVQFVVKFVFVLVLAFFFQLEKEGVFRWVRVFLPYRYRRYAEGKAEAIHRKLAQWIHGQLMLSLAIGIIVFAALSVLRMPYALTLAVLAAFTEFVPVIGPIFAAIPAVFIALAQSGMFSALIVSVVYYGIQWCENNLLVPLIMKRAVGLSPIAIMFAMLVGVSFPETIHPILGILLAVPLSTILSIFIQDYRSQL